MQVIAEERLRQDVLKILPAAMEKAIQSYEFYVEEKPSKTTDKKDFSEYHIGCKTAISHVLLLIKLSQWVAADKHGDNNDDLEEITHKAIAEVNAWKAQEVPDDDDFSLA